MGQIPRTQVLWNLLINILEVCIAVHSASSALLCVGSYGEDVEVFHRYIQLLAITVSIIFMQGCKCLSRKVHPTSKSPLKTLSPCKKQCAGDSRILYANQAENLRN